MANKLSLKTIRARLKFTAQKFILTIGDDGAILIYMEGTKLSQRLFASLNSQQDIKKLLDSLATNPNAPIYIIIDIMDQSYVQQSLPAVGLLTIKKLVAKKLQRDFPGDHLKGYIPLGRAKTGRKDWNYLFAACPSGSPIHDWLALLLELKNTIAGIYLLPLELSYFVNRLSNPANTDTKGKIKSNAKSNAPSRARWQLIITHNKVGGFRQAAYLDGKLIFTRLINATMETLPDILAGNIEQELISTIEYLRRLSFQESDGYDVTIITSQDIKKSLSTSTIKGNKVSLLTPYESAMQLQLPTAASQEDRFADVVISANFAREKHILRLHTELTEKLFLFTQAIQWSVGAIGFLMVCLFIYIGIAIFSIYTLNDDIDIAKQQERSIQHEWEHVRQGSYTMQDALRINDFISLYKLLTGNDNQPLTIISDFAAVKGADTLVKSITWNLVEEPKQKPTIKTVFDVDFYNVGFGFEGLFENFELFIKGIENRFTNYHVEYSRLPDKISFDDKNKTLPVSITISGPKE